MTRTEIMTILIEKYGYKKYLEIGVNTPAQPGFNFESIKVETKHGVDPAVDTTFKMTSDEFFNGKVPMKYDLVFVDGLHVFDQAHRDIVNSLEWLGDNGTVMVHDCNPTTEITQRPDRASNVWHGEIYTIDADEGCAIIRKGSQELFKAPADASDVYTYDFFDKQRDEILHLVSVREFKKKMGIKSWLPFF